ncbi:MAG: penicillin-binding transpeptidase domain-containing protein [Prevotella sp.]|nr:penicillin-binding transpeptidase domain-containing protein [Prevotella sp.]
MRLYTATSEKRRLVAFFAVAMAIVAVLSGRLIYLQIFTGQVLKVRAADQWYRDLPLMAERGTIYDTNGLVLATSTLTYSVYLRPVAVTDKEGTARTIADILGLSYERVLQKASSKTVSEWLIKMQVDKATALKLVEARLDGVYLSQTYQRSYPIGSVGAQVLGIVSVDNHGQEGLEAYYDESLRGLDGRIASQSDLRGIKIEDGVEYYVPAVAGQSLQLYLDAGIQNIVQNVISRAYTEHQAKSVAALVVDITTGGVVASASAPYYDLNEQPRDDVVALLTQIKNSPIINVLEPGSTFKIITLAAALEEDVVSLDDKFHCAGSRTIAGERIKCWKTKGHGTQTLAEGVNNSCNCVFMDLALRLGVERYYQYLKKFGIGIKSGVDFYGEPSGLLLNQKQVRDVDLARMGFGQAIAVSPIQFIATVSALVGDGMLRTPRFVQQVGDSVLDSNVKQRIVSQQTSTTLSQLLSGVVNQGSGKKAAVAGYQIGGKTGTAQKYADGHIAAGKYVSSFLGYLSVNSVPRYACYLYVDEPSTGVYYGSIVAAPYVGEIFRQITAYKKLPFDAQYDNGTGTVMVAVPSVINLSVEAAVALLEKAGFFVEVDGEGDLVTGSFPVEGSSVKKGEPIVLFT